MAVTIPQAEGSVNVSTDPTLRALADRIVPADDTPSG